MTNETEMRHDLNTPLTLEQLREMVDKPVYLYIYDTALDSGWHIIKAVTEDKIIFRGWNTVYVTISSLGKCFDLYAYPPAHIDREAWDGCEFCKNGTASFDYGVNVSIGKEKIVDGPCISIEEFGGFAISWCPMCGRPLTEEAWEELENRLRG